MLDKNIETLMGICVALIVLALSLMWYGHVRKEQKESEQASAAQVVTVDTSKIPAEVTISAGNGETDLNTKN